MGLGQKIKDALHHDQPSKTYENDRPPGAFPSEGTDTKHNKMSDGRDYATGPTTGTTGTTSGTGLTGKDTTGVGRHSPTGTSNIHGGATGDIAGTGKTGHRATDSGVEVGHGHGHHKDYVDDVNRTGERRTADDPYWGSTGREGHGVTGSRNSNTVTGYDDPSGVHGPHGNRAANVADPRVDSDRDHRGAPGSGLTGTHGANKDLPLRPNEQYGAYDSGINRTGGPSEAVGGGTYNPAATSHHDPTSSVDRSVEGREFTLTGRGGTGAGNQPYGGHANNPSLPGAHANDPYDTRMRDRDMGNERTGHGIAGAGVGAGVGAGAAMAASDSARRHHHDDMRDSGYSANNTRGGYNSSANTRGGIDDYSHSGLTGHEAGVPRTSMLDPYNESPTRGAVSDKGFVGGRNGSPPSGLSSAGMGPEHYGPGHEGAKVMHTCSHCGRDNDISRYFKKDVVYRMN